MAPCRIAKSYVLAEQRVEGGPAENRGRGARPVEHLGLTVVDAESAEIELGLDGPIVSIQNKLIDEVRQKIGVEEPG